MYSEAKRRTKTPKTVSSSSSSDMSIGSAALKAPLLGGDAQVILNVDHLSPLRTKPSDLLSSSVVTPPSGGGGGNDHGGSGRGKTGISFMKDIVMRNQQHQESVQHLA